MELHRIGRLLHLVCRARQSPGPCSVCDIHKQRSPTYYPDETLADLYGDDTKLYKSITSLGDCENLKHALEDLDCWSLDSNLDFNEYSKNILLITPNEDLYVVELTVGFESNLHNNVERKKAKYKDLIEDQRGHFNSVKFVNLSMSSLDKPSESLKAEFLSIIEVMKRLPVHNGVTNLLGCITKEGPITIIQEYVPCGDLLGYMRTSRGLHDQYYMAEKARVNDLSSAELMSFAEQIASAMAHLERYNVIHGDLAARNVLVGRQGLCKLAGIGEQPLVFDKDTYATRKKDRLVVKWAAVEVVIDKIRTIQSDVWSFGILLYEIATVGGSPYVGKDENWLLDMLKDDYRMPCPDHVSEDLYSVMSDCWKNDPGERPNFEKLVKVMKTLALMNKHQAAPKVSAKQEQSDVLSARSKRMVMRNVHEAPDQSLQANAKPTPPAKRKLLPTPPNEGRKKQRQELPEPETPEGSQTSDIDNVIAMADSDTSLIGMSTPRNDLEKLAEKNRRLKNQVISLQASVKEKNNKLRQMKRKVINEVTKLRQHVHHQPNDQESMEDVSEESENETVEENDHEDTTDPHYEMEDDGGHGDSELDESDDES
ncbi:proto-oncogene tyrosine- kinase receptor Ret-like, partial [Paramuricea clavata]